MKHDKFLINLAAWTADQDEVDLCSVMAELLLHFEQRGFRSIEQEIAATLSNLTGCSATQGDFRSPLGRHRRRATLPPPFITCVIREESLAFFDLADPSAFGGLFLEVELFCPNHEAMIHMKELITQETIHCFELNGDSVEVLVSSKLGVRAARVIRETLSFEEPLESEFLDLLHHPENRELLRELNKRGSILERDLADLATVVEEDSVKRRLDRFAEVTFQLVNKKSAIVCRQSGEIIFLLRHQNEFESAQQLECPRCSKTIGEEELMPYYEVTDKLKSLINGSRWMPLMVRDALIRAGVPSDHLFTEAKYGEDEIDVVAVYKGAVLVIEAKDRPVTLNDAYKLSAKTFRLQKLVDRGLSEPAAAPDDIEVLAEQLMNLELYRPYPASMLGGPPNTTFVPAIVSTFAIAKDAKESLSDINSSTLFLEYSDGKVDEFVGRFVEQLDKEQIRQHFNHLVSGDTRDSVAQLASRQVEASLLKWLNARLATVEEVS